MVIAGGEVHEVEPDFVEQILKAAEPAPEQNPTDKVPMADTGRVGQDFFNREEEWSATVLGETPEGKNLQVMKGKGNQSNGFYLGWREGLGDKPKEISGWFTSYDKAEQAGRVYLNKQWDEARATAASS